jgi:Domain of unknown function (DUF5916)/Carbohydrate family 9 binding domain-like
MRRSYLIVVACLLFAAPAFAQRQDNPRGNEPPPPLAPEVVTRDAQGHATVRASRLTAPLQLDGKLDEPFYRDIKPISDFVQMEPAVGQPATEKTEVWVLYDDANLYVIAKNWESDPSKRVTSDLRRDANNLFFNDHFGFNIDPFHDRRNGYFFYANARGGMVDAQLSNEQPNNNWNGLWDVRAANFDGGWAIEFRIPFRSLRFKEGGTVWGINFRRMVRWKNEISFLTPLSPSFGGRRGLTRLSDAATLVGVETPGRLRNIDVKPYALGSTATNRTVTPAINNDATSEFGVDAKWGLTQSVVADFTYNTDFAQVEDDEAQVNLTRFSVQFPEKREFFLENQGIFQFAGGGANQGGNGIPQAISNNGGGAANVTPVLFFSRRIGLQGGQAVPITAGGRLNARAGPFQVGALHMHTDDLPGAKALATDFSVLRVQRDVLKRSRIGMIATRRSPTVAGASENLAYGVDAGFNFLTDLSINTYYAGTDSPGRTGSDSSYRGQVNWNADRTGAQLDHLYVGEDFNPEVGFLRRGAFRRTFGSGRFSPRPKNQTYVRKLYYEGSVDYYEDPAGRPESRELQGAFRSEFASSDQFALEVSRQFEHLSAPFLVATGVSVPAGDYDFTQAKMMVTTGSQRPLSGTFTVTRGGFYGGTLSEFSWRGRAEFGPQLLVEPTISLNLFETPWGNGDANIIGSRITYSFSPRMFAAALVQYQSSTNAVSTNARLRWEYQPGSELFVVYSEGRNTLEGGLPLLDTRSLVVKITKLFRW